RAQELPRATLRGGLGRAGQRPRNRTGTRRAPGGLRKVRLPGRPGDALPPPPGPRSRGRSQVGPPAPAVAARRGRPAHDARDRHPAISSGRLKPREIREGEAPSELENRARTEPRPPDPSKTEALSARTWGVGRRVSGKARPGVLDVRCPTPDPA